MDCLVAIVGPTGIGKSQLALRLARAFNAEIVSADSRQVYRHMNIGTDKPCPEELSLIPHHLIDIVNPNDDFSLAQYQSLAYQTIKDIQKRQKLPLLVGGSGLYVWSALEGWRIPPVPPDLKFRRSLEEKAINKGSASLYQELVKVDPDAAREIDYRNVRRVIRALEVQQKARASLSGLKSKVPPPFPVFILGLTADRAELYRRIDLRVDTMIERGLVAEVEKLVKMGYNFNLPAMSGIGYKQIGLFLKGELDLTATIQQIKFETHRFVRHQCAWFRLKDNRIHWFDIINQAGSEIEETLAKFMAGEPVQ